MDDTNGIPEAIDIDVDDSWAVIPGVDDDQEDDSADADGYAFMGEE